MLHMQKLASFVQAALECSVFVAPTEPGLTVDEILEIGKRAGFLQGELGDAIAQLHTQRRHVGNRLLPSESTTVTWSIFHCREEPELRNVQAFDFVFSEFNSLIRSVGAAAAQMEHAALVERGAAAGFERHDIEVAITVLTLTNQLVRAGSILRRTHGFVYEPLPSEQLARSAGPAVRKERRAAALPLVRDVVARRTDGRCRSIEPLDAFAEALKSLGYEAFRLWWQQIVAELRQSHGSTAPVTVCVLAAALVEGALTFVVRHARTVGLGVLGSKTFEGDPRTWRIDDLVASASFGGQSAIFDPPTRDRADRLIQIRQRIHAGRMLSQHPGGPPDLRPEEAREARETAERAIRAVLDWLEKYPVPADR